MNASRLQYTLNSVTGSGHVKYQWNPLACKLLGNSAWKIYLLLSLTSALIVLSHNDCGVHSLIMEQSRNRTKIEEKLKIQTSEFY